MTLLDAVTAAIAEHEKVDGEALVTGYVLIAAFVDTTGEGSLYSETLDNQSCHESLGLLTYALALENHRAVHGDDD